nr:UDP-glucose 4-epimerase GalE [Nereida sp. MMG025]
MTGGLGYIGSHTAVALVEAGYRAVILDDLSNSERSVFDAICQICGDEHLEFIEGDVTDAACLKTVFEAHDFFGVIHFAAKKSVAESEADPLSYLHTNLSGLVELLRAMDTAGVYNLVFSSSATVYGDQEVFPIPETATRHAVNTYGYTKVASEEMLERVGTADDRWSFGVLRYFNPIGAHGSGLIGENPKGIPANLLPYIDRVATGELPELVVYGDDYDTPDGTGVRDYIHVMDLAEGHVQSLDAIDATGQGHVVNIGTGQGYSVLEVIKAYEAVSDIEIPFRIAPRRAGDVAVYCADASLARDVLGFQAKRDLFEMCRTNWAWTQKMAEAKTA